ncbi:aldo/keto reductase, partial [Acidovorax cavernicola]
MQYRSLGNSGISVSPMMLGANVFGWTIDENTSFSVLDACIDQGINFIDTADVYSAWVPGLQGGESETIIGKWFKKSGQRQNVVLATKVGYLAARKGLSAANIYKAVEESLQRLQTDYIDVYFSHLDDDNVPLEETLTAYEKLLTDGKIRAIGASNFSAGRLKEVLALASENGLPRYQVLQPEYNLYDRAAYESGLELVAQEHDLA